MRASSRLLLLALLASHALAQPTDWDAAERQAERSRQAVRFCRRYAHGWFAHADPATGLLPRTVTGDFFWNAKDCAADNFPFLALTALVLGDHHLERAARHVFAQERALTARLDSLPDDWDFREGTFRTETPDLDALIFGASEYAKDGLMPLVEWAGPEPWSARLEELLHDVYRHAPVVTANGVRIPSTNVEVCGELMQTLARLAWRDGEPWQTRAFELADAWLLDKDLLAEPVLRLRDHGCEILGGLAEVHFLASVRDPERHARWAPRLHRVLDRVLEIGRNEHGLFWNAVDPRTGKVVAPGLSDGWGYVLDAFLIVAHVDGIERYAEAARAALRGVVHYRRHDWEGRQGADGYADSIEGAINLLARLPVPEAEAWVHAEIQHLFAKQRDDGLVEGWYGDGNAARTALMYALMTTQGIRAAPWRDDVRLGATRDDDGLLHVTVASEWPFEGTLRFDAPRHAEHWNLPWDAPRINQFPEWFVVHAPATYRLQWEDKEPRPLAGRVLRDGLRVSLTAGQRKRFTLRLLEDGEDVPFRTARYRAGSEPAAVRAWQVALRRELAEGLALPGEEEAAPLAPEVLAERVLDDWVERDVRLRATAGRTFEAVLTIPRSDDPTARFPAVVCIHGHGGNRRTPHDADRLYHRFARALAGAGYATISVDVGQHHVQEPGRTLLGERLHDLLRCVDYLGTLSAVDAERIGCAGLSLGGEMAMWLGALDERVIATVSSGYLTSMDQMEWNHCPCWKFEGLRTLVDWADVYALIAPRALQCQNGWREGPHDFHVPLARRVFAEIVPAYADLGARERVEFVAHPGGHEIALDDLLRFFARHLGR